MLARMCFHPAIGRSRTAVIVGGVVRTIAISYPEHQRQRMQRQRDHESVSLAHLISGKQTSDTQVAIAYHTSVLLLPYLKTMNVHSIIESLCAWRDWTPDLGLSRFENRVHAATLLK